MWVCVIVWEKWKVLQKCLFTFKSELDNRNSRKQWSQGVSLYVCRRVCVGMSGLFCLWGFDSHYRIGKNIYFLLLCLHSAFFVRTKQTNSSISLTSVYLFLLLVAVVVIACTCLSVCFMCVFAALLLVVRFVLFLYWYIMEEIELPWAIISFISLLVLCVCGCCCCYCCCVYLFVYFWVRRCENNWFRLLILRWLSMEKEAFLSVLFCFTVVTETKILRLLERK